MTKRKYDTVLAALEDIFYKDGFIRRATIEEVAAKNGLSYKELMEAVRILGLANKIKDKGED